MPIAILGPTASGKSALAVAVARRVNGAVVNGDPFQALIGLPIGTGQPGAEEQEGVPHVGYGLLPLSTRPNPAAFGELVQKWLFDQPGSVLVTGSGLYLQGIWGQLSDLPEVPESVVARVRNWGVRLGVPALHRYLASVDPARAKALHPHDGARVQRALALHLATGQPPSSLLPGVERGIPAGWRSLVVTPGRDQRRARVIARVGEQIRLGWSEEVRHLLAEGHAADLEAIRPLGYARWMAGGPVTAIAADIIRDTQAYAKRQATWFRHQLPEAATWDPDVEPLEAAFSKLGIP
jgi:tRNA dimethylallyltransferase